ncbi:unnamed protein product [Periconia digitata]|uniref:Embryonic stem cell-specific 5-hydroxymethylcytosine-binding protein n=1 Tax=Periconia digitata TaxID=1303443 RepID=A0A9W4U6N3_9PLEO|nr:unnamed protein product [Periconia digitata]
MPVDQAPQDDESGLRHTYNFAPGNHGLVYRADSPHDHVKEEDSADYPDEQHHPKASKATYKLQTMKWGLIPFWTKRNPDFGSMIKTINCRDDSLYEDRGMWTSMKKKKRCIVVAQGFYEWLKKNNGKDKLPHFTKRKDGQLMCFAGLWDCVQYEDSEEKLYTYTIITTSSNKQLQFLHDRMPVILENGSDAIKAWLDPNRTEWSRDLQSLLKPFEGELECYPVSKDVGKVGNNSPSFVVPINSAANKNNIANFFGTQQKPATGHDHGARPDDDDASSKTNIKAEHNADHDGDGDPRETTNLVGGTEDNAPLPVPEQVKGSPGPKEGELSSIKRQGSEAKDHEGGTAVGGPQQKRTFSDPHAPSGSQSPAKKVAAKKATRSATSNGSAAKTRSKGDGSRKITSFFTNK